MWANNFGTIQIGTRELLEVLGKGLKGGSRKTSKMPLETVNLTHLSSGQQTMLT